MCFLFVFACCCLNVMQDFFCYLFCIILFAVCVCFCFRFPPAAIECVFVFVFVSDEEKYCFLYS